MESIKSPKNNVYTVSKLVQTNKNTFTDCYIVEKDNMNKALFMKRINYSHLKDKPSNLRVLRDMAKREADSMKRCCSVSKNIPKLIEWWDDVRNMRFFIIMEKIKGITLREWLGNAPDKKLTPKDVELRSNIILQLCEIMSRINRSYSTIVHKDLKPENIMLVPRHGGFKVYVLDFGTAYTAYIRHIGTAAYQAPEQQGRPLTSVKINFKTDIFAIGQIFHELLIGRLPSTSSDYQYRFPDTNWLKRPILSELVPELPYVEKLEPLLIRMTEYSLSERINYNDIIIELNRIFNWKEKKHGRRTETGGA